MAGPSILEQAAPSWRLTRPFMLPRAAALVAVEFSQDSLSFMGTKPTPRLLSFQWIVPLLFLFYILSTRRFKASPCFPTV